MKGFLIGIRLIFGALCIALAMFFWGTFETHRQDPSFMGWLVGLILFFGGFGFIAQTVENLISVPQPVKVSRYDKYPTEE